LLGQTAWVEVFDRELICDLISIDRDVTDIFFLAMVPYLWKTIAVLTYISGANIGLSHEFRDVKDTIFGWVMIFLPFLWLNYLEYLQFKKDWREYFLDHWNISILCESSGILLIFLLDITGLKPFWLPILTSIVALFIVLGGFYWARM
jgi:hypothetical protein